MYLHPAKTRPRRVCVGGRRGPRLLLAVESHRWHDDAKMKAKKLHLHTVGTNGARASSFGGCAAKVNLPCLFCHVR